MGVPREFPDFTSVLLLCKTSSLGNLEERYGRALCTVSAATSFESFF